MGGGKSVSDVVSALRERGVDSVSEATRALHEIGAPEDVILSVATVIAAQAQVVSESLRAVPPDASRESTVREMSEAQKRATTQETLRRAREAGYDV